MGARFWNERVVMTGLDLAARFTHSGHWKPTEAWTMQLGQTGTSAALAAARRPADPGGGSR